MSSYNGHYTKFNYTIFIYINVILSLLKKIVFIIGVLNYEIGYVKLINLNY